MPIRGGHLVKFISRHRVQIDHREGFLRLFHRLSSGRYPRSPQAEGKALGAVENRVALEQRMNVGRLPVRVGTAYLSRRTQPGASSKQWLSTDEEALRDL